VFRIRIVFLRIRIPDGIQLIEKFYLSFGNIDSKQPGLHPVLLVPHICIWKVVPYPSLRVYFSYNLLKKRALAFGLWLSEKNLPPCWIRISIFHADPYPGGKSFADLMRIRIRNTGSAKSFFLMLICFMLLKNRVSTTLFRHRHFCIVVSPGPVVMDQSISAFFHCFFFFFS
jgi:hypothetical protein